MQGLNNVNEARNNNASTNNKKIFIIICIYLFLTLTSKYSKSESNSQIKIKNKLITRAEEINANDVVSSFEAEEIYLGHWVKSSNVEQSSHIFDSSEGKFEMSVSHVVSVTGGSRYKFEFAIYNGEYVDKGVLSFAFYIDDNSFTSLRTNETLVYFLNSTSELFGEYNLQNILIRVGGGETKVQAVAISFSLTERDILTTDIDVSILNNSFSLQVEGKQNRLVKTMIFAAILFIVSFSSFSSLMKILRDLYDLHDNPRNYSLVTICLTCMWDAALCIVAFIYAFSDQQGLMLFIMPAFLFCLLFTNLQPRFMILIYQQSTNTGIRDIICKFNLFHYGTLFLIYPILIFTNINWILFIGMSMIYLPQIYTNGINGVRPEITSTYYTRYLLSRLLIILYIRCFPYNVFGIQPDYILSGVCILIVALQFFLLYVQKRYGSKKVIPSFLLDPVFNYKLEQQVNVEEGGEAGQCSICLTSLSSDPAHDPHELEFEPPFKLMKTPCNHHYHSRCLMVWMKVKMECPQCRFKLPPYE